METLETLVLVVFPAQFDCTVFCLERKMLGGKCLVEDVWWKMSVGREMPLEFAVFLLMILYYLLVLVPFESL